MNISHDKQNQVDKDKLPADQKTRFFSHIQKARDQLDNAASGIQSVQDTIQKEREASTTDLACSGFSIAANLMRAYVHLEHCGLKSESRAVLSCTMRLNDSLERELLEELPPMVEALDALADSLNERLPAENQRPSNRGT